MHSIDRYAEMRQESARVGERPLFALPKTPNELELQARWFAGEFGRKFQTLTGAPVEIVQFGFWNHEAGPDFQNAAIRIAGGPVLHGSIAIGNCTAMLPIQPSMTPFSTSFSNEAEWNSLLVPVLTATFLRFN
jgi:hypothetical protein